MKNRLSKTMVVCVLALLTFSPSLLLATEYADYSMSNPSYSPDGQKIVFESDALNEHGDILLMNADGSDVIPILRSTAICNYSNPAWSPDGKTIAYDRDNRDPEDKGKSVWVMNADGSDPRQISTGKYNDMDPAWHPNGTQLVISSVRGDESDLILLDVTGVEVRYVAATALAEGDPDVSPDGQWVVYNVLDLQAGPDQDETSISIYKRPLADISVSPTQLTSGVYWDFNPKFSPDGSKIAFSGTRGDGIQIMDADGTNLHKITVPSYPSGPNWSPDGTKMVFVMGSPDPTNPQRHYNSIYTINVDGTGLTQLTHTVAEPAFDPDEGTYDTAQSVTITCSTQGATIRYATDGMEPTESSMEYTAPVTVDKTTVLRAKAWKKDFFPSAVKTARYTMQVAAPEFDPDGGTYDTEDRPISAPPEPERNYPVDSWPTWSPDGQKIAFISNREYEESDPAYTGYGRLWLMNADGSSPVQLTSDLLYEEPCWSPDGQKIACNAGLHIVILDINTLEQTHFTRGNRVGFGPSWSPDGSKIAFAAKRTGGDMDIHVAEIGSEQDIGGQPRLVARAGTDWNPAYSPDGSKIAFRGEDESDTDVIHSVYIVNADGTGLSSIYSTGYRLTRVSWLPNAEEVITDGGIIINVSTHSTRAIPRDAAPNGIPASMLIEQPHVSPDGTKIAFVSYDSWENRIATAYGDTGEYVWVANIDGTGLVRPSRIATPAFDPDEGTYDAEQTVTITCSTQGATIRYTTDGTEPTESSMEYTAPVTVDKTTVLRAKAWKTDYFPSAVNTAKYVMK